MRFPNFTKEITVGKEEGQETETVSLSILEHILLQLTNSLLNLLERFDSKNPYFEIEVTPGETDKVRLFFFRGFIRRSKYYLLIFIVFVIALWSDITNQSPFNLNLQVYGLLLDCFGAVLIASGLFRGVEGIERDAQTRSAGLVFASTTVWKDNKSLSAVVRNTVDGFWGMVYLVSGFSVQIMAIMAIVSY